MRKKCSKYYKNMGAAMLLACSVSFAGCGKEATPGIVAVSPPATPTAVPTMTPEPTKAVEPTPVTEPTNTPTPTLAVEPTKVVEPTKIAEVTPVADEDKDADAEKEVVTPTVTTAPVGDIPGMVVTPTLTVEPTKAAEPTKEPTPTATPKPTATPTPKPTATPKPTPLPTATPVPVSEELTAGEFAKIIFQLMDVPLADDTEEHAYDIAVSYGFIDSDMFASATSKVYRKNAFVVFSRMCDYLGYEPEADILDAVVSQNRIADLSGSEEEKKAMQSLFAMGIVEGKSQGICTKARKLYPKKELNSNDAQTYAERIVKVAKRRVLSPDGQVTRTTDLPKFAQFYPYILDSFPNSFYDINFDFMRLFTMIVDEENKRAWEDRAFDYTVDGVDYNSPATMGSHYYTVYGEKIYIEDLMRERRYSWEEQVENHLMLILNANYKTTPKDTEWQEKVLKSLWTYGTSYEENAEEDMKEYLKLMKEHKIEVECDRVVADCSTMYYDHRGTYIRAYVHFRVNSAVFDDSGFQQGPVAFIYNNPMAIVQDYTGVKLGEWQDTYVEVRVNWLSKRDVNISNAEIHLSINKEELIDIGKYKRKE